MAVQSTTILIEKGKGRGERSPRLWRAVILPAVLPSLASLASLAAAAIAACAGAPKPQPPLETRAVPASAASGTSSARAAGASGATAAVLDSPPLSTRGAAPAAPAAPATPPTAPAFGQADLAIPPTSACLRILEHVRETANRGDSREAWAYVHYLIDLFDFARFAHDSAARTILLSALGVEDGSGSAATDQALDRILVAVDRLLAMNRLHPGALAARVILEHDRTPATNRSSLLVRAAQEKTIARSGGPLAANATLRLFALCNQAFRDAVSVPYAERPRVLSYCLYPLWDSDPEPFFATDPSKRRPDPSWHDLSRAATDLTDTIAASTSRIAILGKTLKNEHRRFVDEMSSALPVSPMPGELRVPEVPTALPYSWAPLLDLGNGTGLATSGIASMVTQRLSQARLQSTTRNPASARVDRLAIALTASAPASLLLLCGTAARAEGADWLELVVGYRQMLRVPPNDYWYGRTGGGSVQRLGVLPLSLRTNLEDGERASIDLSTAADTTTGSNASTTASASQQPSGSRPAAKRETSKSKLGPGPGPGLGLGLGPDFALEVDSDQWRLISPKSAFPAIPTNGDVNSLDRSMGELRRQLAEIKRVFPGEDHLHLIPGEGTTYAAFVSAAVAARYDAEGRIVFGTLELIPRMADGLRIPDKKSVPDRFPEADVPRDRRRSSSR
ncbi:MAG: hypothetical protein V2A73_19010 [Pseudomonadota bacterium]